MFIVIVLINYFYSNEKNEWIFFNFFFSIFKLIKEFDGFFDRKDLENNNYLDYYYFR